MRPGCADVSVKPYLHRIFQEAACFNSLVSRNTQPTSHSVDTAGVTWLRTVVTSEAQLRPQLS